MAIVPDGLEYSMGCASLMESGRYGIWLNGVFHPSRYLPWFSSMICLPAVRLFHGDIFAAIYSIWFCAAGAVLTAFLLGRKNGTWMTGLCAASLFFLSPLLHVMLQLVATEIPYIFFLFLMLAIWLKITEKNGISWFLVTAYAVLTACAGAIRSSAFPMLILPWGFYILRVPWRKKIMLTALLLTPACLVLSGGFLYNLSAFGSGFRNGYQYWCPVPYDYPSLVFSLSYIRNNVEDLYSYEFFPVLVCEVLLIGLALLFHRKKEEPFYLARKRIFTGEVLFASVQGAVLILLYMPYFFRSGFRFFMPLEALLALPAVTAVEVLLQKKRLLLHGGMVLLLCLGIWKTATHRTYRFKAANEAENFKLADQFLPEDAVLISNSSCALAEYYFVKRTARRYVPLSRDQEYVNKVVAPVSAGPLDPPPAGPVDHLTEALLRSPSCQLPYCWTVAENPEEFRHLLKTKHVFLSVEDYSLYNEPLRKIFPDAVFLLLTRPEYQCVEMMIPDAADKTEKDL